MRQALTSVPESGPVLLSTRLAASLGRARWQEKKPLRQSRGEQSGEEDDVSQNVEDYRGGPPWINASASFAKPSFSLASSRLSVARVTAASFSGRGLARLALGPRVSQAFVQRSGACKGGFGLLKLNREDLADIVAFGCCLQSSQSISSRLEFRFRGNRNFVRASGRPHWLRV